MNVAHLLDKKGHDVWTVRPESSVLEALQLMAEKNIGALLVVKDGRLIGIFSERDYARKVILKGKASKDTPVSEIMTTEVAAVTPGQSIQECMRLMTDRRFRHLPVIDNAQLQGLISIGDVVKSIITEQEFLIGQLENYIAGSR